MLWERTYDLAFVDVAGAVEEGVHCDCGFGGFRDWWMYLSGVDWLDIVVRE